MHRLQNHLGVHVYNEETIICLGVEGNFIVVLGKTELEFSAALLVQLRLGEIEFLIYCVRQCS